MDHVAIMKKKWGLLEKIISGTKTVESRWYKNKCIPWNKINPGDVIYFKNSGDQVKIMASVEKIEQFNITSNKQALKIMEKYAKQDLGSELLSEEILEYIHNKKYAIFVTFKKAKEISPFFINKKGFGLQSAWLCVENINTLQL